MSEHDDVAARLEEDLGATEVGEYDALLDSEVNLTRFQLPPDLTYEAWAAFGRRISRVANAVMWWYGEWWRYGEHRYGEAAYQAAPLGYKSETLQRAARVCERIPPEERDERLSFGHYVALARLETRPRGRIRDRAIAEDWTVRDTEREVSRAKSGFGEHLLAPPLPNGLYDVGLADPPWRYEHAEPSRAIENQYPTMTLPEICDLGSKLPFADDAALFLWSPAPKFLEAAEVMEAWGFRYRTHAVWDKSVMGMGYWFRQQSEDLLVGVRGDFRTPEPSDRVRSIFKAPRGRHSEKPEFVYELIEGMVPTARLLELFARRNDRPRWTVWGAELSADRRGPEAGGAR
jgi:N6-adenosine-specific RNA methylase IME4